MPRVGAQRTIGPKLMRLQANRHRRLMHPGRDGRARSAPPRARAHTPALAKQDLPLPSRNQLPNNALQRISVVRSVSRTPRKHPGSNPAKTHPRSPPGRSDPPRRPPGSLPPADPSPTNQIQSQIQKQSRASRHPSMQGTQCTPIRGRDPQVRPRPRAPPPTPLPSPPQAISRPSPKSVDPYTRPAQPIHKPARANLGALQAPHATPRSPASSRPTASPRPRIESPKSRPNRRPHRAAPPPRRPAPTTDCSLRSPAPTVCAEMWSVRAWLCSSATIGARRTHQRRSPVFGLLPPAFDRRSLLFRVDPAFDRSPCRLGRAARFGCCTRLDQQRTQQVAARLFVPTLAPMLIAR